MEVGKAVKRVIDRVSAAEWQPPKGRLPVGKTYKMFVGGAFIRSESGRTFQVSAIADVSLADPATVNVPLGSRKDVRDAVLIAKNAQPAWWGRSAYNRGQILYRLAEVMEARREELTQSLVRGGADKTAQSEVDSAIERTVYYAGFCDKVAALLTTQSPTGGPHFTFSVAEPMGVVGIVAPPQPALLGLVSSVLPVIAGGNTCVAIASESDPRTSVLFCECLATSDLPAGVVNVLTGQAADLGVQLAKHRDVAGIDLWSDSNELRMQVERDGAESVKRVTTHDTMPTERWIDSAVGQGLGWVERFVETKTVWHPVGL